MNKANHLHLHVVPEPNDIKSITPDILIDQYIALQQFSQAEDLIALHPSEYMYSLYISALYRHGYTELVKQKLLEYECKIENDKNIQSYSYFVLTWIKAVIAYDEGNYTDATKLFELLTLHHPESGQTYYALASSSLHESIQNLHRRIDLYHPAPEQIDKINTYITHLSTCIQIVDATGWRTQNSLQVKDPRV